VLESCGCKVTEAASVPEAIAAFERAVPDVLVSDVGMPGKTGYDLIAHIRALAPARGGDVPALALTAYARPEDRGRLLNAGFSMYLSKPVEPSDLVAVIASLTRFRRRAEP
jgi:CheY-like chemotaxis protein